ncbi:MAG: flippase-like domain-containing protein, partial [Anaerolineales bacterium]|nr:flippase-like domain-containing protein [Anaerolineales bacterium]
MADDSLHQPAATNQKSRSPLSRKLVLGLLLGFAVFVGLILVGDIRQVGSEVRSFPWQIMPAVLGLTLWNYLLRFIKWHYFLKQVKVPHIPVLESARLFVAGFPLAVTPGKVGETLKGVWLNQMTGFPTAMGVSVVLAERISDGLAMLILSAVGVIAYRRYWPAFAIVLGLLLGAVIISQIRPLAQYLISWGPRLPLVRRFASSINDFYEGTFTLFRPWTTFVSVSLGTISWLAEGVGFYLILLGLGVAPGVGTLSIAIFVLSFSTVIGAVSALPGGLLATDASIVGMLVLL